MRFKKISSIFFSSWRKFTLKHFSKNVLKNSSETWFFPLKSLGSVSRDHFHRIFMNFTKIWPALPAYCGLVARVGDTKDPGNERIRSGGFQRGSARPERINFDKVTDIQRPPDFSKIQRFPQLDQSVERLSSYPVRYPVVQFEIQFG